MVVFEEFAIGKNDAVRQMEKKIPTSVLFIDLNKAGGRKADAVNEGAEGVVVLFTNV